MSICFSLSSKLNSSNNLFLRNSNLSELIEIFMLILSGAINIIPLTQKDKEG